MSQEHDDTVASSGTPGAALPTPDQLATRFPELEIIGLIGRGGMGAVYKARQRSLDRLVAIKILPAELTNEPAFAERFTPEARSLARLAHPNIVGIHDSGVADGLYYFVMEYVDGVTLRDSMRSGSLTQEQALELVLQVCAALQFAHEEDVVHRDIKPENILIDRRGRVKIADFGLAKVLRQGEHDRALTGTHQVMGTFHYMAPEQMGTSRSVDQRADIFSLGVVLYELLTGDVPVGRFAPPSRKGRTDPRLDEVVSKALEMDPDLRYRHVSELKTAIEPLLRARDAGPSAIPVPASENASSSGHMELLLDETDTTRRSLQNVAAIAGAALAAIGGIVLSVDARLVAVGVIALLCAAGLFVVVARTKQEWEVDYRQHKIRFENHPFTGERLLIDGVRMARGGIGRKMELTATIPGGEGAGDKIVAWVDAKFLRFRCRIFAERRAGLALASTAIRA